jgi:hypothetical protein
MKTNTVGGNVKIKNRARTVAIAIVVAMLATVVIVVVVTAALVVLEKVWMKNLQ